MCHLAHLRKIYPFAAMLMLSAMALLLGCGYLRFPYAIGPSDFTITVTPVSTSVIAGSPATAYGFTVTPTGASTGLSRYPFNRLRA